MLMYKISSGMEIPVHQLEHVHGVPFSLFSDREAEQLAFPFLFPDGINGYRTAQDPFTSTSVYFQTRLLSSDPHWAVHVPYLLWSCNVMEQHRLQDNISIALRMCSSGCRAQQGPVINRLTAGQQREVSDNPELSENYYAFLHDMRGTIAYWQTAKLDLFAMFRTLGPPTFFITLSANDMNRPDLLAILAKQAGMEVTEETIAQLSCEQKRELCNNLSLLLSISAIASKTLSSTSSKALEVQLGK